VCSSDNQRRIELREKLLKTTIRVAWLTWVILCAAPIAALAQDSAVSSSAQVHVFDSPKDVKWGPAPPMLPKGAQIAVLDGDPMKSGVPFTLRLKMPDGYKVPAHSHPTDENVTVLMGSLGAGMGDRLDPGKGQIIQPGGFVLMPKGVNHFAWTKGTTVVQIHGLEPLDFKYVNPSDDPRNQHS
jgi:hypothetical protein